MSTGPWSVGTGGQGIPVVFDKFIPDRRYAIWFGTVRVKDEANLAWLAATLNRLCKRAGCGPTKAMLGNARRRELLRQIRARTFGPYWIDEATALDYGGIDWQHPVTP